MRTKTITISIAEERYNQLRANIYNLYNNLEQHISYDIYTVFKDLSNINHLILDCCYSGLGRGALSLAIDKSTPANVLFYILKITKVPILFREFESLFELIYNKGYKKTLVEAMSILYALDIINITFRDIDPTIPGLKPSDIIEIQIKESL